MKPFLKKLIDLIAHPGLVFISCGWLMVLLVIGTIAQRYVGLFVAQNFFFYSWVLMVGPVPLPGGMTTMCALTLGLLVKLLFKSDATVKRLGAIVSHIGALLLMVGAVITFYTAVDGAITLFPGDTSDTFTAYHDREWVAFNDETNAVLSRLDFNAARKEATIKIPDTSITATIIKSCRNCAFTTRDPKNITADLRGRARDFDITPLPPEQQDEDNRAAALFQITGTDSEKDGIHLSADFISLSPFIDYKGKRFHIAIRKVQFPLPFKIELTAFRHDTHPGTDMARFYESDIIVHENGTSWPATIRMNAPFRYRGYTFYQSSLIKDQNRDGTVIAVVKNDGHAYPYIASFIMALGVLIHLIKRLLKKPRVLNTLPISLTVKTVTIILLSTFIFPSISQADSYKDVFLNRPLHDAFATIPIQNQGRIKPIDTFARSILETFSGRDYTENNDAVTWIARVLFTPETVQSEKIFRIQNNAVRDTLGLTDRTGHRYSITEIIPALTRARDIWGPLTTRPQKDLSLPQKQLLELVQNVDTYIDLSGTFVRHHRNLLIDNPNIANLLNIPVGTHLSISDLKSHQKELLRAMTALNKKAAQQKSTDKMLPHEKMLIQLIALMQEMDMRPPAQLFRVIPDSQKNVSPQTSSAWSPPQDNINNDLTITWQQLAQEISSQNTVDITKSLALIKEKTRIDTPIRSFKIEHILNTYHPMTISLILYTIALISVFLMTVTKWHPQIHQTIIVTMITTLLFAISLHLFGIMGRMIILSRPPVTNLYDSILFVGIISVIGLSLTALFKHDKLYIVLAAITAILLQSIGLKFDTEGDTLQILSAVLDTNFWLATHVVMITCGYATSIITAMIAHTALFYRIIQPHDSSRTATLYRTTNTASFIALFTTTVGTILGGIWADQSWGRFWGWDPKENGALLIVLWLIWVLHGRIGGFIHEVGTLALLATLNVIVALAWFGVNLLGVGLHSYGFTQNATIGLILFCTIEIAIILGAVTFLKFRKSFAS